MSPLPQADNDGRHTKGRLPDEDYDGEEERRTIGSFAPLSPIEVADRPQTCPACGTLINPLTGECRC